VKRGRAAALAAAFAFDATAQASEAALASFVRCESATPEDAVGASAGTRTGPIRESPRVDDDQRFVGRRASTATTDLRDHRGRQIVPLGPSSIRKLIDTLAAILDDAIEDGHIDRNPARGRRMRVRMP
jgi:hypothetical protein